MELGGYIAYTVGGYKCLPFGRDSGITDAIRASSSNFDMPQPIDLQPGRVGFRRTRLHSTHGMVFVYSAFVGVSETGANRPGSFLAVGLGFLGEIDCRASGIGAALRALLEELKGRVTQGNRFVAMPDADVLRDFLSQNTPTLDGIRESVNLRTRPMDDAAGSRLLLLADSALALEDSFGLACNQVSGALDMFVFDASAEAELRGARSEFRVSPWPPRAVDADIKARVPFSSAAVVAANTIGPPVAAGVSGESRFTDLADRISDLERYQHVAESRARRAERIGLVTGGSLLLLLLLAGFAATIGISRLTGRLEAYERQLAGGQTAGDAFVPTQPARDGGQRSPPSTGNNAPPATAATGDPILVQVEVRDSLTVDQVRRRYCAGAPDGAAFEKELRTLNPGVDTQLKRSGLVVIALPGGCKKARP